MLSQNRVQLLSFSGGDESHAQAAWVSTSTDHTQHRHRVPELLSFLATNDHGSPFEHSSFTYHVRSDLATHIQFLKHRAGVSINTESARYRELTDDSFYLPGDWPDEAKHRATQQIEEAMGAYHDLLDELTPNLGKKRAKETARLLIPYAHQLSYVATFNFRSFMHFQKLRNSTHAQDEIASIADEMLVLLGNTGNFCDSLEAFGYSGYCT